MTDTVTQIKDGFKFSTHILTRRMTFLCLVYPVFNSFSTHILTRRMTEALLEMNNRDVNFQLTSSQGG